MLTIEELARATSAKRTHAAIYVDALNEAMDRYKINTPRRIAAFLATVAVESQQLTKMEEGLYYRDPARLLAVYPRAFKTAQAAVPYARNPSGLSQLLYKGYHGRGMIALTWERNYKEAGEALGFDFVRYPAALMQPRYAALSAAWYWATNGCNEAADRGDMDDVTRRVNGPARMHQVERVAQYKANMEWIA